MWARRLEKIGWEGSVLSGGALEKLVVDEKEGVEECFLRPMALGPMLLGIFNSWRAPTNL